MSDGMIYTVNKGGSLLFFKDRTCNGTQDWAHGGLGQVIGSGFGVADSEYVF